MYARLVKQITEGFEFPVLQGLEDCFRRGQRPPIICEVAPAAYPLLRTTLAGLRDYMLSYGYEAFRFSRTGWPGEQVDIRTIGGTMDVMWMATRT